MGAKISTIKLFCPHLNIVRVFSFCHAERLLKMRNNGGWIIQDVELYELTENGIKFKQNKRGNNEKQKRSSKKQSD